MENTPKIRTVKTNYHLPSLYQKVGIYCRVSSMAQTQMGSLAQQASFFVRMVAKRYDWQLEDIYIDVKSGETTSQRTEFQRMLDDCQNGKLDIILTKSISRFGRNTEDTIKALRLLKAARVTVIFDAEKLDTASGDSELMISILSAYAEAENDSRRKNQYWSIVKQLENGTSSMYNRACYGYRKGDAGELLIDQEEAAVVQDIFNMYLSGSSIVGIQRELERREIPSPTGKAKWCKRSLDTMLSNEKYMGDAVVFKTYTKKNVRVQNKDGSHDKYVISGNHPAIISSEMFQAVQDEKKRRSNVEKSEAGVRRKETKYSSKRTEAPSEE